MKLKNGEIFAARASLQKLAAKPLPVKASFAIAKLANKLNGEFVVIEQVRNALVVKYGVPDEEHPGQSTVPDGTENFGKFVAEFNELLEQEVEVVFEVVVLPEMVDGVALVVEPETLMTLEKFVTVE